MNNNTPETDALDRELHTPSVLQDRYSEMRDYAQKLERERDEALKQCGQLKAMRDAIKEVEKLLFAINLNDMFEDTMRNHAKLALTKLKPFLND